jgi:hypothetical protein
MSWAGHVACMEEMRNLHQILVRKRDDKMTSKTGNITVDLNEMVRVYGLDSLGTEELYY